MWATVTAVEGPSLTGPLLQGWFKFLTITNEAACCSLSFPFCLVAKSDLLECYSPVLLWHNQGDYMEEPDIWITSDSIPEEPSLSVTFL